MAVADIANATPATTAPRQSTSPADRASAPIAIAVSTSWAAPRPNMSRRIASRRPSSSSSPMRNSSITTPSSATATMLSGVANTARPNGPMTMPATR